MRKMLALLYIMVMTLSLTACFFDDEKTCADGLNAYNSNSPYARVLVGCACATKASESCKLSKLPTIGMETPSPTVEDIMERVVVSDEWMGVRFEALLRELPDDILYLTQAVTAVVIGSEIRPSYYWNLTGAIYLDPGNLWLTQDEKVVISTDPDHRDAYSDPMAFRSFWRWTKDSADAWPWVDSNGTRPFSNIILPMAALLFHELAHANDLFPLSAYANVSFNDSIYTASNKVNSQFPSSILTAEQPILSEQMFHLASILYLGTSPSEQDTQTTAAEVGGFFEIDFASDDYAYTSQFEDVAMLFEEAMMKIHYNVDRDMAFVTPPAGDAAECDDYTVDWGTRNRLGDLNVIPRAQYVLSTLLPEKDYSTVLNNFPSPTKLRSGIGWCTSISLQPPAFEKSNGAALRRDNSPLRPDHYTRPYRLMH